LGHGGFGKVSRYKTKTGEMVAIKSERMDEQGMTLFFEYWVYWYLHDKNSNMFVKPLGFIKE
jgi:hypothetical protein